MKRLSLVLLLMCGILSHCLPMTTQQVHDRLRKKIFIMQNERRTEKRRIVLQAIENNATFYQRRKLGNLAFWLIRNHWEEVVRIRTDVTTRAERSQLFIKYLDEMDFFGMSYLLSLDQSYLFMTDEQGNTPLHILFINHAYHENLSKIVMLFLAFGADAHLYNYHGQTPYWMEAEIKLNRFKRFFLSNTTPYPIDYPYDEKLDGLTESISYLLEQVQDYVIESIIALHDDFLLHRNLNGENLFYMVMFYDFSALTEHLIQRGVEINQISSFYGTPLDFAHMRNKTKITHLLRSHGAKYGYELSGKGKLI